MGDYEQLATKMQDLDRRVTESNQTMSQELRDLRESVKAIQNMMELQSAGKAKVHESEVGSGSNSQHVTKPSIEHHEGRVNTAVVPRYSKLEFPSFNGLEDPLGWLYQCEQFFFNQRTGEEEKVGLASFHMTGEAQLWSFRLDQEEPGLTWDQFKSYCLLRFGPPLSSNPLGELANLKQAGTVEEYQSQFQMLLARATTVRPDQQVDLFTAGLTEALRVDVEMQQPPNLVTAMNVARAFERKFQLTGGVGVRRSPPNWSITKTAAFASPIPANHDTKQMGGNSSMISNANSTSTPFMKKLSRAEMAERRAKGLCYNCDESFSTGHKCKHLFCLMVEDSDEELEPSVLVYPT